MSERRRHRRSTEVSGRVTELENEDTSDKSPLLIDLSEGGLRLVVEDPLDVGTKIRLQLEVVDCEVPIHATAQVVWCRQSPPYEVGVRFIDLDPEQRHNLERLASQN